MARFLRTETNVIAGAYASHSRLMPPVVVVAAITYHGPGLSLARPNFVQNINQRKPSYKLKPPTVVSGAIVFRPTQVNLNPDLPHQKFIRNNKRKGFYFLREPKVVTPAVTEIARPIQVNLNVMLPERQRSTVTRRRPQYDVKPPIVVNGAIIYDPLKIKLTPLL